MIPSDMKKEKLCVILFYAAVIFTLILIIAMFYSVNNDETFVIDSVHHQEVMNDEVSFKEY